MPAPVFPTGVVRGIDGRNLAVAAAPVTSPFTKTQDIQDWGGECWEYSISIKAQHGADGRSLSAFLAALRGPVNPFLFDDPTIEQSGSYGTPLVDGSSQTGNTLVTDGWGAEGLKTGDFFSLGTDTATRFYQLTADVVPLAGAATLEFVPALRSSPANDEALEVRSPQVLLRANPPIPADISAGHIYRFTLSAREAI